VIARFTRLIHRLRLHMRLKPCVRFGMQIQRLVLVVGPGLAARVVKGRIGFAQADRDKVAAVDRSASRSAGELLF
jgi:hypothetical protein